MQEGEVPDPRLRLKSPLSVPAYCPTRLKLLYDYFDAPGLLVSALLWCVSQLFLRHYAVSSHSPIYTHTHLFILRDSPLKFLLLLSHFQLTQLVCQAMTAFTIKGCNKQSTVQ